MVWAWKAKTSREHRRRSPSGPGGGSGRFPRDKKALGSSSDTARTSPEARATLCTVEYAMAAYRRDQDLKPEPEPQRASRLTADPRAAQTAAREGQDACTPSTMPSALGRCDVCQASTFQLARVQLSPRHGHPSA
ncbi:hypothetical protein STEG23_034535 [Scotinomys teguina]